MRAHEGLAGVIAGATSVSEVAGAVGELRYRGYPIEALVDLPLINVVHLVLAGELPTPAQADRLAAEIATREHVDDGRVNAIAAIARTARHPMLALQAAAPLLADAGDLTSADDAGFRNSGLEVAARLPVALDILRQVRNGISRPRATVPNGDLAQRTLARFTGRSGSAAQVRAFAAVAILQLDHGFNASTFAARVAASTQTSAAAAISAAIGTLYGPLHGGADEAAITMARAIGGPERATEFVAECARSKRKIMGMGHREYRVLDPRARIIEGIAETISAGGDGAAEMGVLKAVAAAFRTRAGEAPVHPNIEFYKGVVYLACGLPVDYFTPAFAVARVYGWLAHALEARRGKLIRPAAEYVGPSRRLP